MIDGKKVFDQPIKSYVKLYENSRKITIGQDDDCIFSCLLDYPYFEGNQKMNAVDLSKQQAIDADPKVIQQIIFTEHLERAGRTIMFFLIEEGKETILDFSQRTLNFLNYFGFRAVTAYGAEGAAAHPKFLSKIHNKQKTFNYDLFSKFSIVSLFVISTNVLIGH